MTQQYTFDEPPSTDEAEDRLRLLRLELRSLMTQQAIRADRLKIRKAECGGFVPRDEWLEHLEWRASSNTTMLLKESEIGFLEDWLRRRLRDQLNVYSDWLQLDPDNPITVLFHVWLLLRRMVRSRRIVLDSEENAMVALIRKTLEHTVIDPESIERDVQRGAEYVGKLRKKS